MDQEPRSTTARELFEALRDHAGPDAYAAVVAPWLDRATGTYGTQLAEAGDRLCRETFDGPTTVQEELSWELYALSRVSDVLLLAFQPAGGPMEGMPWAHRLHAPDRWPRVEMAQYLRLFTRLGMASFDGTTEFDAFLHEIVEVEQAEDPDEPIRITELVWPGLWLGPLLFSRAGVRIRAGANHAEHGVADRSPLYWTFLRRHRPTVDLSHGWGHNSQWRTDFRLDHRLPVGARINADGYADIDTEAELDPTGAALLTPEERRQLLVHRCLVRTPSNAAAMGTTPSWATEFFPFHWQLPASGAGSRVGGHN
jgi:hypothetical protein